MPDDDKSLVVPVKDAEQAAAAAAELYAVLKCKHEDEAMETDLKARLRPWLESTGEIVELPEFGQEVVLRRNKLRLRVLPGKADAVVDYTALIARGRKFTRLHTNVLVDELCDAVEAQQRCIAELERPKAFEHQECAVHGFDHWGERYVSGGLCISDDCPIVTCRESHTFQQQRIERLEAALRETRLAAVVLAGEEHQFAKTIGSIVGEALKS
jgi:hypothetical protein